MFRSSFAAVSLALLLSAPAAAADQPVAAPQPSGATLQTQPYHPAISAFGRLPLSVEPQLSPDGTQFATIQDVNGRPAMLVYTVGAPPGTKPKGVGPTTDFVRRIKWLRNDRLLITLEHDQQYIGEAENFFVSVFSDANGENFKFPFANSPTNSNTVVDLDLDDPSRVLMPALMPMWPHGMAYSLFRVDVYSGAAQRIADGTDRTSQWISDGKGTVAGRVERTRDPFTDHLESFQDGSWKELGAYDASGGRGANVVGLDLGGSAFVRFASDRSGMNGLAATDRSTGRDSPLYFNSTYDVDDALEDPWTGRVIGASFIDDREQYTYFDPAMEALQRGLEAAFPGRSAHAVSWDLAKDKVIVAVAGARQPLSYYYLDRTTHQATRIASTYPELREADLGEMRPYPYKARDGLDIPAYLTLPPGKDAKNLPTVILPHGGPEARDEIGFDWMAAFFANRGYAVLQPNFRGSTGYGVKFLEAGFGQWGLQMQDDVTDGVRKLIADGIADPKRICIVGGSYGGYAALEGAASTPDLYACAASWAGVFDLRKFLRTGARDYGKYSWMISTWTRYIGDRYDDSEKLDAASPALHADKIRCPVLLMHGAGDTTVRVDQSEEMNDALKDAHKNVSFVKIDADTHYMELADTRIRFLTETEKFLKANIGD